MISNSQRTWSRGTNADVLRGEGTSLAADAGVGPAVGVAPGPASTGRGNIHASGEGGREESKRRSYHKSS